jgi:NAD-dependent DNA ligase
MSNLFARMGAAKRNELMRSLGALTGIAQGLLCDGELNDKEILFLNEWLRENEAVSQSWPADIIAARVRDVLRDGVITASERDYLVTTLEELIGGDSGQLAAPTHVTELAFDHVERLTYQGFRFCLTGDFIYAPRRNCEELIELRGGVVGSSVTKKLNYLVVGERGSTEWKHGSFGTKIERAIELKREGLPILIVRESLWTASIS